MTATAGNGLTSLARLASDTGGRFSERSNDLTLGYTRAESDLSCVYTLGFYVEEPEEDRVRNLTVRVRRDGLRAIHPSKYVFRSESKKKESMLFAAWNAPEMFETGVVRAHAYPLRPVSNDRWDALLAVSFPVPLGETVGDVAHRDFGATLHDGPRVAHRFHRRISLEPDGPEVDSIPTVTFLERVKLKPGKYTLTAVMTNPGELDPHARKVEVVIPEIPRKEVFLVGPILGRPSGPNLVVTGGGPSGGSIGEQNSFEPLLVHQLDEAIDLAAFSQACIVSKREGSPVFRAARSLRDTAGGPIGSLPEQELVLEGDGAVRCGNLVDVLPVSSLPDGEYVFEARLDTDRERGQPHRVRFAVGIPPQATIATP